MLAELDAAWHAKLLEELEAAIRTLRVRDPDFRLARVARKVFAKLADAVDALPGDPADTDLHRVRIKGKRARYAAELAAPLLGKPPKRFLRRAKELQDVLGENQDAVFARAILRELRPELEPEASFVLGRLVERQDERRRDARRNLPRAWKRLSRARL